MKNIEKVLKLIQQHPEGLDDDEISDQSGIQPRQQVYQICKRLEIEGKIRRRNVEKAGKRSKIHNFPNDGKTPYRPQFDLINPEKRQRSIEKEPTLRNPAMSSIVLELQSKALDSTTPLTEILRLGLVVAKKLAVEEFQEWVESELKGYPADVPEYRILKGQPSAHTPNHGWYALMTYNLDAAVVDNMSSFHVPFPIAEIEADVSKADKDTQIYMTYNHETEKMLIQALHYRAQPGIRFNVSQFQAILDAVRTVVVEWTLKLEQSGILGEGLTFTSREKDAARSINFEIQNYIENATNTQIQQSTIDSTQILEVQPLDLAQVKNVSESLRQAVNKLNIAAEKNQELLADLSTVESQLQSPKPKPTVIRESLDSIRNILEGAAGSILESELAAKIAHLLL